MSRSYSIKMVSLGMFWVSTFVIGSVQILNGQESVDLQVTGMWHSAAEKAENCSRRWKELSPLFTNLEVAAKDNDFSKLNALELGKAYGKSHLLFMESRALLEVFETAGKDHEDRQKNLRTLIERGVTKSLETKEGQALAVKAGQRKKSTDAKRAKEIENLFKLVGKKEYEAAEKGLLELNSDIDTIFLFLNPADRESLGKQVEKVNLEVSGAVAVYRQKKSKEMSIQAIKDLGLNLSKLMKDIDSAQLEIRSAGSTQLNGKDLGASQAFEELLSSWMAARAAIVKASGFSVHAGSPWLPEFGPAIMADASIDSWKRANSELTKKMSTGLLQIINSDATRVSTADVPKHHRAYVAAIARHSSAVNDPKWILDCETALTALVKKDPAYAARVDQYRKVTDDVLNWRGRIASSRAKATETKYTDLLSQVGDQTCLPQLTAMLPKAMLPFQGKAGAYCSFKGVSGNSESQFGSIDRRVWCSFDRQVLGQGKSLVEDLFATSDEQPLSLEAAIVKSSLEAGDFERVGGIVKSCRPHSMSTLFAKTKTLNPGTVSEYPTRVDDMTMEVVIKPEWIQHKYFFAEVK